MAITFFRNMNWSNMLMLCFCLWIYCIPIILCKSNFSEGDIRLADGPYDTCGRLEVYHNDVWGTVCHGSFSTNDAKVVCRQLGYDYYLKTCTTSCGYSLPAGVGQIWMDDVQCSGSENRLTSCPHGGSAFILAQNCGLRDVFVWCKPICSANGQHIHGGNYNLCRTCVCNTGYSGNGTTCYDIDECSNGTHNCNAFATCNNVPGTFQCACNDGYVGDGTTTCSDIDECADDSHNCHRPHGHCNNTAGNFTCSCNTGYSGNGVQCTDTDECAIDAHDCHYNGSCANTIGSYECKCNNGYEGDGKNCTDINECAADSHDCHSNATCTNTDGSFNCDCNAGFEGDGKDCPDIDECAVNAHDCHYNGSCANTVGSYECQCNNGYEGGGKNCTDINECTVDSHDCHSNATCTNTDGSFNCDCNAGFEGDGKECSDIDECAIDAHDCHYNGSCANTIGSYECKCNNGYEGDGKSCTDINECTVDSHDCHSNATCTNTDGSFNCDCNAGFEGDGKECSDTDECVLDTHDCHFNATCTNTVGFYDCDCNAGFGGNGFVCKELSADCVQYDSIKSIDADDLDEYLHIIECRPDLADEGTVEIVVEKVTDALSEDTNTSVEELQQKTANALGAVASNLPLKKPLEIKSPVMDTKIERKSSEYLEQKGWEYASEGSDNATDSITIDQEAFKIISSGDINASCDILGIAYNGLAKTMANNTFNFSGYPSYIAADVVTTTVICNDVKKSVPSFYKKTLITPTINIKNGEELEPRCVYWNESEDGGSWSDYGCEVNSTADDGSIVCFCNHTTNYAILMQIKPAPSAWIHDIILHYITYIGCSLSIMFLSTAQLLSCALRHTSLSGERVLIHRNLMGSLLVAMCLFMLSGKFEESPALCKTFAIALHLAYSSVFCWMFVEAIHLYRLVILVYGSERDLTKVYYAIGYGLPVLIVSISVGIGNKYYGLDQICWLSVQNGFIWAFVGPALGIIFLNTVVLLVVIKTTMRAAQHQNNNRNIENIKLGVRSAFMLFPMLGTTWILGLVSSYHIAFSYLFSILNSFQGVWLSCVCILFNTEVRKSMRSELLRMTSSVRGDETSQTKTNIIALVPTTKEQPPDEVCATEPQCETELNNG